VMKTTDALVEAHGRDTKVACVGPAGENMVLCAAIANDKFHYLARCAVGAVMGSKNLKAISINGTRDIRLADPRAFLKVFSAALGISNDVRARVQQRIEARLATPMESMRANAIAPSMRTPLLIIHDRDDKEVPLRAGQSIADGWPGAELIITEGLGHQRILRAEAVANSAVSFIDAARHWKTAA